MDPERLQELCDAYVLGALDGEERQELDREIAANTPELQRAMRLAQETAAQLVCLADEATPAPALRAKILASVENAAKPTARTESKPAVATPVVMMPKRPNYIAWAGWAAAAALTIAVYLRNDAANRATGELVAVQQQMETLQMDLAARNRVISIIRARDSQTIRLVTGAPQEPQYRAYWSESTGLVLAGNGVPALNPGRTLQLWIVPKQGAPISAGLFQPTANGEVLLLAVNLPSPSIAAVLAITDEPAGGSPAPTMTPRWVGPVVN
jgi:anti-sigma-K factor RskA